MSYTEYVIIYHTVAKHKKVSNMDTVFRPTRILSLNKIENFYLCFCLVGVFLVSLYYF